MEFPDFSRLTFIFVLFIWDLSLMDGIEVY